MSKPTLSLGALAGVTAYSIHPAEMVELRRLLEKQRLEEKIAENNDVITAAANALRILASQDSVLAALRDAVPTLAGRGAVDVPILTYTCTSLLRDGHDVLEDGSSVAFNASSDGRDQRLRDLPPGALLRLVEWRKNYPLRKLFHGEIGQATLSLTALFIGHRVSLQVRTMRVVEDKKPVGYCVMERSVVLRFWTKKLPEIYQIWQEAARKRWGVPDFQGQWDYPARPLARLEAAPAPAAGSWAVAPVPPPAPEPAAAPTRYSVCGCVPLPERCPGCDPEEPARGACACTDEDLCGSCSARWQEDMEREYEQWGGYEERDYYDGEVNHGADMEY
jgi:hypothetical protein